MTARDPRIDPRPGDVIDDDAPRPPLLVSRSSRPDVVVLAARYTHDPAHPEACGAMDDSATGARAGCKRCVCVGIESWNIDDWRDEMVDADVLWTVPDGLDGEQEAGQPPRETYEREPAEVSP